MKIYVGNLSWQSRDTDLTELFSAFGTVESSTVIMERDNPNRSRGIAFVVMPDDTQAAAAIAGLNDTEFMGRNIMVNEARPMTDRPPRTGGYAPRTGGDRGGYAGGSRDGGFGQRAPRRDYGGNDNGGYAQSSGY
jgi:RNA recognition motif-containing protein